MEDVLLAPTCSIEKETLWDGIICLTSGSETDEGIAKDRVFARTGNPGPSTLSTKQSLRPSPVMRSQERG